MNRLNEILERKKEIRSMLEGNGAVDMEALEKELRALNDEQAEIERRQQMASAIQTGVIESAPVEKTSEMQARKNLLDSLEYREAFMEYVCRGVEIPIEYRANANTTTADVGALVPPATLNKIVEKIESFGELIPLVNRTSYKTGMTIPMASIKSKASWVAEGAGSDRQKAPLDASVTFGHFKLRCAVSVSLETEVMTLSAFEARLINSVSEAMARAIQTAILKGTGSAQPTGILANAAKGQTINVAAIDYKTLVSAEAALSMEYESGAVWVMTKKTFMEFVGMVDTVGQPIGHVDHGIGGVPERTLLGRRVVLTNDLPSYVKTLKKADVFAFIYNFGDYTLNTNYSIGIKTYEDNETDDLVRKTIMICDGKPIEYESFVKLTGNVA